MTDKAFSAWLLEQRSPAAVIALLEGKALSGAGRAVDMQLFGFGKQLPTVDWRGRHRTIGEYRLHVQSHWRIRRDGISFVTYDDIRQPTTDDPNAPFDPDLGSRTLRDELVAQFVAQSALDERTVENAASAEDGELRIMFRGGAVLEVDAAAAGSDREAWRLLLPDGSHAVMSGSGFAVVQPPAS